MSYLPLPSPAPDQPSLAGFEAWFASAVGIPTAVIPSDSVFFSYAYNVAIQIVNLKLNVVGGPIYMLAVYNLAADNVINWAPDPSPPVIFPGSISEKNPQGVPYMQYLRNQFRIAQFVPGIITESHDETTGESFEVLEQFKGYTLGQLQNLKTPWGRQYLAFAASVGSLWNLT